MIAAQTSLPVLGVPIESKALNGIDNLLSIVQMPRVPWNTSNRRSWCGNAALLAVSILSTGDKVTKRLEQWRSPQTDSVADIPSDEAC